MRGFESLLLGELPPQTVLALIAPPKAVFELLVVQLLALEWLLRLCEASHVIDYLQRAILLLEHLVFLAFLQPSSVPPPMLVYLYSSELIPTDISYQSRLPSAISPIWPKLSCSHAAFFTFSRPAASAVG